jgi:hypothetical protein
MRTAENRVYSYMNPDTRGIWLTSCMKLQLAGIVKRLNVEHRTSNIEHRMTITLRFVDLELDGTYSLPEATRH